MKKYQRDPSTKPACVFYRKFAGKPSVVAHFGTLCVVPVNARLQTDKEFCMGTFNARSGAKFMGHSEVISIIWK